MKLRAPAIPLITVDPYFSVWSRDTAINMEKPVHWTGSSNYMLGSVTVDGKKYVFLGYNRDCRKIKQTSLSIDALSTTAVFENDLITLKVVFTSPLLLDDMHTLSRPVSYVAASYEAKDGKKHDVSVTIDASEELCMNKGWSGKTETAELQITEGIRGIRIGNIEQKPLNRSGDDVRIDWGYFCLAAACEEATVGTGECEGLRLISVSAPLCEGETRLFLCAYDDIFSLEYFGKHCRSFWNKDGMTIEAAIAEAALEYEALFAYCNTFSQKLYGDALAAGGEKYAEILSLSYRQVMAAHKVVLDENGELLFVSKECFSNGCAATVDVSYPSIPLFLLYNPELLKGLMRPIYRYAESDAWTFDFAPHDVGQYPLLNGQVYGDNKLEYQMPVEECGNMLIMETNLALASGTAEFAGKHLDTLTTWCKYLLKYGADPADQLCTDDFAGHLAHNCNLALKAIMGVMGMAILMTMLEKDEEATYYATEAKKLAEGWLATAINEDGSSKLAFDQPDTFSMKYNMVWDKLWKTELFTQEFRDCELSHNKKHFNEYGMPLDSRADYTKSDWMVWVASMASDKETFADFIEPLWKTYNESVSRVPLGDWYDTVTARTIYFQNRTVQGGLFMQVLMKAWENKF